MTRAERNRAIRELREERRDWVLGRNLHWGVPWCPGYGYSHQPPLCEGCAVRAYGLMEAARIDKQITALLPQQPPLQGTLF